MLKAKSCSLKAVPGFTLVELLVTVSIIGILSSITYFSVGNIRQMARDSKRLADMKQLQTALEFYFNQTNGYPLPPAGSPNNTMPIGDASHMTLCTTLQGFVDTAQTCQNANATVIMARVPASPYPPNTPYKYTAIVDQANNNRPAVYQIAFMLESDFAGFQRGVEYIATPSGIRRR